MTLGKDIAARGMTAFHRAPDGAFRYAILLWRVRRSVFPPGERSIA